MPEISKPRAIAVLSICGVFLCIGWYVGHRSITNDNTTSLFRRMGRIETAIASLMLELSNKNVSTSLDPIATTPSRIDATDAIASKQSESEVADGRCARFDEIDRKLDMILEILRATGVMDLPADLSKPKNVAALEETARRLEHDKAQVLKELAFFGKGKLYDMYGAPDDLGARGDSSWWIYSLAGTTRLRFYFCNDLVGDVENN